MIWLFLFLVWIAYLRFTRQVIRGHDGSPYLVRYFIWRNNRLNLGRIYLHHILRSDEGRSLHSHPWNYCSLILLGGYWEVADARCVNPPLQFETHNGEFVRWFSPGSWLRRGAGWRHRLELPGDKTAWTLVFTTRKIAEWGFYPAGKFCHHTKYSVMKDLCEE